MGEPLKTITYNNYSIYAPCVWISTYIYHTSMVNVGTYSSPMEGSGYDIFLKENGKSIIASNWIPAGKKLPDLHLPRVAWASGQSSTFPFSNESLRDSWDFDRWFLLLANLVCWELFFGSYMFLSSQCFELLLWTYAQGLSKIIASSCTCFHMLPLYVQSEQESDNPTTLLSKKSVHHIMQVVLWTKTVAF